MYSIFGANGAQKPLPAAFCFFPLGTWKNGKKWFICCFLKTGPFVSFSGNMVLLVLLAAWLPWATAYGPVFLQTPPAEVLYSNNTGLVLDCLARGDPPPIIDWVDANGHVLSIHPSVARWENSIQCDPTKTGLGDKGFGLCLPKKQRSVGERPRCKCIFPIIDFWLNLSLCTQSIAQWLLVLAAIHSRSQRPLLSPIQRQRKPPSRVKVQVQGHQCLRENRLNGCQRQAR